MYDFYFYLLVLAIISPIRTQNKKKVLQKLSIENEIIFTSMYILFMYGMFQIWRGKKNEILTCIDGESLKFLLLNATLTCISLYLGGNILMRENVFKYKTLQKSVNIIVLLFISVYMYDELITPKSLVGLLCILIGSYYIDGSL